MPVVGMNQIHFLHEKVIRVTAFSFVSSLCHGFYSLWLFKAYVSLITDFVLLKESPYFQLLSLQEHILFFLWFLSWAINYFMPSNKSSSWSLTERGIFRDISFGKRLLLKLSLRDYENVFVWRRFDWRGLSYQASYLSIPSFIFAYIIEAQFIRLVRSSLLSVYRIISIRNYIFYTIIIQGWNEISLQPLLLNFLVFMLEFEGIS